MIRRMWISLGLLGLTLPGLAGPGFASAAPRGAERLGAPTGTGELVISELFYDPEAVNDQAGGNATFGNGEFIELYNPGASGVDLFGWRVEVKGGERFYDITAHKTVPAGGYLILASQSNLGNDAYGVMADLVWDRSALAPFFMRNDAEDVTLLNASDVVVSRVAYDEANGWPAGVGKSIQLAPTLLTETYAELSDAWCVATANLAAGTDKATPKAANTACAGVDVDADGYFTDEEDCDDNEADAHYDLVEVPDDGIDNDCDGIEITTRSMDPSGDEGNSPNDLTGLYMGWDDTRLVIAFDYAIQDRAFIYHFDLGLAGGETNFNTGSGYTGAFPTSVSHTRGIDLMFATYGGNPAYLYSVVDNSSTDISGLAETVYRTNSANDGTPGMAFVRIPWDDLFGLGAAVVPSGLTIYASGMVRAGDDASPYGEDFNPDNSASPVDSYAAIPVDANGDGDPDTAGDPTPTPVPPTPTQTSPPPTPQTDGDGDGYYADEDCDDNDIDINPGADEIQCNGADDDCDALTEDAPDDDLDGYDVCPADAVGGDDKDVDCDDSEPTTHPDAAEVQCDGEDNDCAAGTLDAPDGDGDGYDVCDADDVGDTDGDAADCNDGSGAVNPGADETLCNGIDDDCDAQSEDAPDDDQDSYDVCGPADTVNPDGRAADCDDLEDRVNPGKTEVTCNGLNDDCAAGTLDAPDVDADTYDVCGPADAVNPDGKAADCLDSDNAVNPGKTEATCNGKDDDCSAATKDNPDVDGDGFDICNVADPGTDDGKAADCNDNNANVNPGKTETTCNGVDDDCSTTTPDNPDVDNDGYDICNVSDPGTDDGRAKDCNDANANVNPGKSETTCNGVDDDCSTTTKDAPDVDGDGYDICSSSDAANPDGRAADCQDSNAAINPGATELCDGVDNNCANGIDENTAADAPTWYLDADGDDYGRTSGGVKQCSAPTSDFTSVTGDCDDSKASVYPGATETCNRTDDDCDSQTDEDFDDDGDGYFETGVCSFGTDCNDSKASINPAATEHCDGVDENCDGVGDATTFDVDNDGYLSNSASCSPSTIGGKPATDCNDAKPLINPAASEVCDSVDNDCDGQIDDADSSTTGQPSWYIDGDSDGYGKEGSTALKRCVKPTGYVSSNTDCDDTSAAYNPGIVEECTDPNDYNCDGSVGYEDKDSDGYAACEECDDDDPDINPAATEVCDEVDNDCDGKIDDADDSTQGEPTWYPDADGDGARANTSPVVACVAPDGYISASAQVDCADNNDNRSPLLSETCDSVDNDCDTTVDEDTLKTFYADTDADAYGDPQVTEQACSAPEGYVANSQDCDDDDATLNPETEWYVDSDNDGVGNDRLLPQSQCLQPTGYVRAKGDCNDLDAAIYPDAPKLCDGKDNDCDGLGDASEGYDADGDTYLSDALCGTTDGDCDDSDAAIHPGAGDTGGNEVDEDCDGVLYDVDGDGYGVDEGDCNDGDATISPAATDVGGNEIDEDCDGVLYDVDGDGYAAGDGLGDDCDDGDAAINPSATDLGGNEIDEDCDGVLYDVDGDGYGVDDNDCDDGDADINPGVDDLPGNEIDEDCDGVAEDIDDDGFTTEEGDCDDRNPDKNPDVEEIAYDGIDQDCDGKDLTDVDGDGFDSTEVSGGDDCDDSSSDIHPDATEVGGNDVDEDCDGEAYDVDNDGYGVGENDCNDDDPDVNPGVEEICGNVVDEDCDGAQILACEDVDGDGYRTEDGDCADEDPAIHPNAAEVCDDLTDNNCNAVVDEGCEDDVSFFGGCSTSPGGATPEGLLSLLALLLPAAFIRRAGRRRPQSSLGEPT